MEDKNKDQHVRSIKVQRNTTGREEQKQKHETESQVGIGFSITGKRQKQRGRVGKFVKPKKVFPPPYKSPIDLIESPFLKKKKGTFFKEKRTELTAIGNVIRLGYKIQEGEKERIQYYEGLVIGKQNRGLGESFTLRRNVQGIGVEQLFPLYSPKILSLIKKQESKVRRAKLYFLRSLTGKAAKLRVKF